QKRRGNGPYEKSFYLTWLRKKIPLSPKIKFLKVQNIYENIEPSFYTEVRCVFGAINIIFKVIPCNDPPEEHTQAMVSIDSIDGKPLDLMFDQYLDNLYKSVRSKD